MKTTCGAQWDGDAEGALNKLFRLCFDRVARIVRIRLGTSLGVEFDLSDRGLQRHFVVAARELFDEYPQRSHAGLIQPLARIVQRHILDAPEFRARSESSPSEVVASAKTQAADEYNAPTPPPGMAPSNAVDNASANEIYDECIASLPADYRELILLRQYAEASWDQICDGLGGPKYDEHDSRGRARYCHTLQEKYRRAQVMLPACLRLRLRH